MRRIVWGALMVAALALGINAPAQADQVQVYDVVGTNPGANNGGYTGTVTVRVTDHVARVVWQIGSTVTTGTGLFNGNVLAIGYPAGKKAGVSLVILDAVNGSAQGMWTSTDTATAYGTETWTLRP